MARKETIFNVEWYKNQIKSAGWAPTSPCRTTPCGETHEGERCARGGDEHQGGNAHEGERCPQEGTVCLACLEGGWRPHPDSSPPLLSKLLWEKYSRITLGSNQVGRSEVPRLRFCSQRPCLGWCVPLEVGGGMNWIG